MGVQELSTLLWRERELLELLTFKLTEEQLLLTAGYSRWMPHATREVEQAIELVRGAGFARTVEASAVAVEWGIDADATLRDLANAAPEGPWGDLLAAHLAALTAQTEKIKELKDSNEQFIRAASRNTQEALTGGLPEAVTYNADGRPDRNVASRLFDTKL